MHIIAVYISLILVHKKTVVENYRFTSTIPNVTIQF